MERLKMSRIPQDCPECPRDAHDTPEAQDAPWLPMTPRKYWMPQADLEAQDGQDGQDDPVRPRILGDPQFLERKLPDG
jgi:hypothetical protein